MKLGTGADPVNAYTFKVDLGQAVKNYPFKDSVTLLTSVNGTEEMVNFGARVERVANFSFGEIPFASFVVLIDYLRANLGKKIKFEISNSAENPWGQAALVASSIFYGVLVDFEDNGERGFTVTHSDQSVSLNISYTGTTSTSRPNEVDTSLLDICLEVDTVRAEYNPANVTDLAAITGMIGGNRALQVDTHKLYLFDPSGSSFTSFNDGVPQLAGFNFIKGVQAVTNSDIDGNLFLNIVSDGGGFFHINFYKDSPRTLLVAHTATYNTIGLKTLIEDSTSGISGSIKVIAVSIADSDIKLGMWKFLYTLVANNTDYGLVDGIFYLSSFADISSGSSGAESKTWKSGLINKESISFPKLSIDISQGPSVERIEGFSFALNNTQKFWTFVVDNKIIFHGARIKLKVYDRSNTVMVLLRTGINHNNTFNYVDYTFQAEPSLLAGSKSYPVTLFNEDSYPYSNNTMRGKPIVSTLGRWPLGTLQVSNFAIDELQFPSGNRLLPFSSYNAGTPSLRVGIATSQLLIALGIDTVAEYPALEQVQAIYIKLVFQIVSSDIDKLYKIVSFSSFSATETTLILEKPFEEDPDSTSLFRIFISTVELIIEDEKCLGFDTPNYLISAPTGTSIVSKELYARVGDKIQKVPENIYIKVGTLENKLTINPVFMESDSIGSVTVRNTAKGEFLLRVFDQIFDVLGTSRAIDFGFNPLGILSINRKDYNPAAGADSAYAMYYEVSNVSTYSIAWKPNPAYPKQNLYANFFRNGRLNPVLIQAYANNTTSFYTYSWTDGTLGRDPYFYILGADSSGVSHGKFSFTSDVIKPVSGFNQLLNFRVKDGSENIEATIIWGLNPLQKQVRVYRNDILITTIVSTTQNYYVVPVQAGSIGDGYAIRVSLSLLGDDTKNWFIPDGVLNMDLFHLKNSGGGFSQVYTTTTHLDFDTGVPTSLRSHGYQVVTALSNLPFPTFAGVFTWLVKIDHSQIKNVTALSELRLLTNFVVHCMDSYLNTAVPIVIQLRGVRKDKSTLALVGYYSNDNGLELKVGGGGGCYGRFVNLPLSLGGLNTYYDDDVNTSNVDGLYTGKDLWRLPNFVFENNNEIWNDLEYLMFCVSPAVQIPSIKFNIGIGRVPGRAADSLSNLHSNDYIFEFKTTYEGGLEAPQFARIDGGVLDDASGTITGTPNALIEKVRDIVSHGVKSLFGYLPKFAGIEMNDRRLWLGHLQAVESMDQNVFLTMLAKNSWGCFTISSDEKLYLRSLNLEDESVVPVCSFDNTNILRKSISSVTFRRQSEIFQKFRVRYNYDPSVQFNAPDKNAGLQKSENPAYTEEMVIGWDNLTGKKVSGGFTRFLEDANQLAVEHDLGDENSLADKCRQSLLLYATGKNINELGSEKSEVFPLFYRFSKKLLSTGQAVEKDLPNQVSLYGNNVFSPKVSLQKLFKMLVDFYVFDAWQFSFDVNIKYVIYTSEVSGYSDESLTVERKLKLLDKVEVTLPFQTDNLTLTCFVTGLQPDVYKGLVKVTVFAIKPPGQLNTLIDPIWDAGFGGRVNANFKFKDESYGLSPAPNLDTFADAGYGTRVLTDYDFPDGTRADSQGEGTGQI